jgi:hypothetical protein
VNTVTRENVTATVQGMAGAHPTVRAGDKSVIKGALDPLKRDLFVIKSHGKAAAKCQILTNNDSLFSVRPYTPRIWGFRGPN